ncbi:hypothetical protein Q7W17_05325 [Streptococcus suis]|nr:hypothetical protein [Streptococcus suis]
MLIKIKDCTDEIQNETTKRFLKEVVTNIESKNYRSAIVVLYTTMLYDILKQLEDLRDFYDNDSAKAILSEVYDKKSKSPTSPAWETYLIDEIYKRGFITQTENEDLRAIQRLRNYGAHPIIENDNNKVDITLREIKKSEVILAQENAFDIIFSRQFGLGTKYVDEIFSYAVENIKDNRSFSNQFADKYLKRLSRKTYQNLFKLLYKATFVLDDSRYIEKRELLVKILKIVVDFNHDYCLEMLKEDNFKIFSSLPDDLVKSTLYQKKSSKIFALIKFIKLNPIIWEVIPEEKKEIVKGFCDEMFISADPINDNLSSVRSDERRIFLEKARFLSSNVFLYDDFSKYFQDLRSMRHNVSTYTRNNYVELSNYDYLKIEDWELMVAQCDSFDILDQLKEYMIEYFRDSATYVGADYNIEIVTSVDFKFSQEEVEQLLEAMNENSQFYDSKNKKDNLRTIVSYFNRFSIQEKLDKYSNLKLN